EAALQAGGRHARRRARDLAHPLHRALGRGHGESRQGLPPVRQGRPDARPERRGHVLADRDLGRSDARDPREGQSRGRGLGRGRREGDRGAAGRFLTGRLAAIESPVLMQARDTQKTLFRRVEKAIEAIQRSPDAASTVADTAAAIIENFRDALGVRGGRLYARRDGGYGLPKTLRVSKQVPPGPFVPDPFPPIERALDDGVVVMGLDAPGVDAAFERRLGVDRFASIAVGDDEYILSFNVDPSAANEDLVSSLSIL